MIRMRSASRFCKFAFLLSLWCVPVARLSAQPFELTGVISNARWGSVALEYNDESQMPIHDSVRITANGFFRYHGRIDGPAMMHIIYRNGSGQSRDRFDFFVEPGSCHLSLTAGSFATGIVTGSATGQLYASLEGQKFPLYAQLRILSKRLAAARNDASKARIRSAMVPLTRKLDTIDYHFFDEHPESVVTAYMLRFHTGDLGLPALEKRYGRLPAAIQQGAYGKLIAEAINRLKAGTPGMKAAMFTKTGINDSLVSLQQYLGNKYVLLDFWASWCIPCRQGNPHLRQVYAKYRSRDLEIIGVADDDATVRQWKQAVAHDSLTWPQVLRGANKEMIAKGEHNPADLEELYGVHDIPTKILVDKNGVIVSRISDEDDFDEKMKQIFGE